MWVGHWRFLKKVLIYNIINVIRDAEKIRDLGTKLQSLNW